MAISQQMEKRTLGFGLIIIFIFLVLALRLAHLQLVEGESYLERAEINRLHSDTIGAPRGKIYSTNGEILVTNKLAYSVTIDVKALNTENKVRSVVQSLSSYLDLNRQQIIEKLLTVMVDGKVYLMTEISPETEKLIIENPDQFPGLHLERIETELDQKVNLYVDLQRISQLNLRKSLNNLTQVFSLNYEDLLLKVIGEGKKSSRKQSLRVKRNITQEEMVVLEENLQDLPEVTIEKLTIRDYVYGSMASHVLGYTGAISEAELQAYAQEGYLGDDYIGKTGLEKYYEFYLRGQDGKEQFEVNSSRQKVRTLGVTAPLPGADLYVNLDIKLQQKVEKLLEEKLIELRKEAEADPDIVNGPKGGAIIVMDPQTGKILALTSKPDYNLNLFSEGIDLDTYNELSSDPNKPFLNRAMSTAPPGSIFKLVTAATVLEEGIVDEDTLITDANGRYTIGEWKYDNWARNIRAYGDLTVRDAIAYSNNIYFYDVAHQLYKAGKGGQAIPEYARGFGLGKSTGIDLPSENPGLVPDREWKEAALGEIWYPGNDLHLAIGQGFLKTSPLQLINYVSAIGNGGTLYRPYIVERIESYDGMLIKENKPKKIGELPVSKENLQILKEGMVGVTSYGTARRAFNDLPIIVAGKTGTAQISDDTANHGWFAGFAPADDPKIAILVFIEQGISSSNTLPIVREILKYYFEIPDPPPETDATSETDGEPVGEETDSFTEVGTQSQSNQDLPTDEDKNTELQEKLSEFYNEVFSP